MFFSSLVLLSQNVTMSTTGGEADGKVWVTLLPVFVYMDDFLTTVMYPGMSVDLLILIREDSFRIIRKVINDPLCKRTLDSVLLEVSGRFEEILLGYDLKMSLSYPGSGAKTSAKDTIFDIFTESGNETSNDGSSFPGHGDAELASLRDKNAFLEEKLTSKNKLINVLREEKSTLRKENDAVLKENEELRRRVNSGGSVSKRGQDEGRTRSNSRGRSGSRSRDSSSGRHSKKPAYKKKVNYDSDR